MVLLPVMAAGLTYTNGFNYLGIEEVIPCKKIPVSRLVRTIVDLKDIGRYTLEQWGREQRNLRKMLQAFLRHGQTTCWLYSTCSE